MEKSAKGWEIRDLDMILDACADDFVYDDPYDGRMTKAQFAAYLRAFPEGDELVVSHVVLQEARGETTAWGWWAYKRSGETEWAQEGADLVRSDADGVHSQRIAYYKR
jgi:hypothetical protein